ncbi:T9SS type A sorting domain-containing protein [candidate division KSB1 bacterium]|nr:T9SS type A sorting domain-containing protein [candidate division KSB1 bacterium]
MGNRSSFRLRAILLSMVALISFMSSSVFGDANISGTVKVDCDGYVHQKTFAWTITKTASPAEWNLFKGDEGTSIYTITVDKDNGTLAAWVEGVICIENKGKDPTEDLSLKVTLTGFPGPEDVIVSQQLDLSENPVLDPEEAYCYSYKLNFNPMVYSGGGPLKVRADAKITNGPGGSEQGVSQECVKPHGELPTTPELINDNIRVNDSNGSNWSFTDDASVTYDKEFSCEMEGENPNTASITYINYDGSGNEITTEGPSASAKVTVNCFSLGVIKDANTSFKRTYNWTIDKSADQSSLTLSVGQQFTGVNYSVLVSATSMDNDWRVNGTITITNPAPIAATINSVSDVVSVDIAAIANFGVTFPYTLTADGTLTGTYSASLPNATSRTNTATATLQNYSYPDETKIGTTIFSGTAAVDFSAATINHVDECVDVSDTYKGSLGTHCYADGASKTFTYSRDIGPYSACGDYTVDNTASFVTSDDDNDSNVEGSDSYTITVHVPCAGGCTRTFGYWKTHSSHGPAPEDDVWGGMEDDPFFLSGQTYYQVLRTPPAGNVYYNLAHQYIAAELNFMAGASDAAVKTTFAAATALFNTYTPASTAGLKGKAKSDWTNLASILDKYNNGLTGPGHCDEDDGTLGKQAENAPLEEFDATPVLPTEYALEQNYPNPFNPATTINYALPQDGQVTLTIYDITGQEIAALVDEQQPAGSYTIRWNATNYANGVYLYKLTAGNFIDIKRMVLLK